MSVVFTSGISSRSSHGASLLDRVGSKSKNSFLSEIQRDVDQLVGGAITTASDEKMMVALFGAGLAGRLVRLGSVASFSPSTAPLLVQAASHLSALAGESAVFAGMERKFAQWEGHHPTQGFQKDWARAFINLGSIKLLGGAALGQNLITQHLLIDTGMVTGHHAGYALGVTEKPQGSLAREMIQAEGMNLGMKGSLALLHGVSPRLSALDRSMDLAIHSRSKPLSSGRHPFPFFSPDFVAAEGNADFTKVVKWGGPKGLNILKMSDQKGDEGHSGNKEGRVLDFAEKKLIRDLTRLLKLPPQKIEKKPSKRPEVTEPEPQNVYNLTPPVPFLTTRNRTHLGTKIDHPNVEVRKLAVILLGKEGDPAARPVLEKVWDEDPHPHVKILAIGALAQLGDASARIALDKAFVDADQHGKRLIISTWVELGDAEAKSSLRKALKYPDSVIQQAAASALERLDPPEEAPVAAEDQPIPLSDLVSYVLFTHQASIPQSIEMAENIRKQARSRIQLVNVDELLKLANTGLENILNISPARRLSAALRVADALMEASLSSQQRESMLPELLRRLEPLEQLSFAIDFYEKSLARKLEGDQNAKLLASIFPEMDPKARLALTFKLEQGRSLPEKADFAATCLARIDEMKAKEDKGF